MHAAVHNNACMMTLDVASPRPSFSSISSAPGERPGKSSAVAQRTPARSQMERAFCLPRIGLSGRRGATTQEAPWPPPGQRIHPAGSRSLDRPPPRRVRRPTRPSTPPASTTPAASASSRTRRARGRTRSCSMALEAVARVAHRGAASTDNSGDGAGLLTQIPRASSTATPTAWACTSSRACRSASAPSSCRVEPEALGAVGAPWSRRVLAERRHPVPRLARRAGQSRRPSAPTRARVLPGDPAGAGGPPRAGGRRGRLGARAVPGATGDGAAGGGAETCPASTSAPSPAAPSSTRRCSPGTQLPAFYHRLPLSRSTRAPSRSSTSATRPTRCRAGRWRSRSGCWPTTARSTRSGATGTR